MRAQVRIANSHRFGKSSKKLSILAGQQSFFDEADAAYDASVEEPDIEEVVTTKKKKTKGQRELDLNNFPVDVIPAYRVSEEELDQFYGKGNWRRMPDETYKRLRHEPEAQTVELHTVEVYVGTGGEHQDEFLRGKRPKDLLRNSIVTPSLLASILNVKYVNSSALNRVAQEFERNGVNISKQTMSNWIIWCADRYFAPFVERMRQELLKLPDVTNANCWAHARCDYADAIKAADKSKTGAIKNSIVYQALERIGKFYEEDEKLKNLPSAERLQKRQLFINPLVEDYFARVKEILADTTVLPKGKTADGLKYSINQEKYLKVFLDNPDVPIDNSASERSIRTFCIGKKNWMFHNTANGASSSALVYSISETAKLNNLRPCYYFKYILTELPKHCDEKGNIDTARLDYLMPWSESLPEECREPRRS